MWSRNERPQGNISARFLENLIKMLVKNKINNNGDVYTSTTTGNNNNNNDINNNSNNN